MKNFPILLLVLFYVHFSSVRRVGMSRRDAAPASRSLRVAIYDLLLLVIFMIGGLMTLAVLFAAMLLLLMGIIWFREGGWSSSVFLAACLSAGELAVMTAIAIFFSTCTSPTMSGLMTFSAFISGHFSGDLKAFSAQAASPALSAVTTGFYYLFPNLELFNARGPAVHDVAPTPERFVLAIAYMVLYSTALLMAAVLIFRRREFR